MEDERWIQKGAVIESPELQTSLGDYLLQALKDHDNKSQLIDGVTGEELNSRELIRQSVSVALELRSRGVQPRDVVCCSLSNCMENAPVMMGCFLIGAVYAPINPELDKVDKARMLNVLEPRIVLSIPMVAESLRELKSEDTQLVVVVPKRDAHEVDEDMGSEWRSIINRASYEEADAFEADTSVSVDDPIAVMCSSGTTGPPKGVMLSHKNFHYLLSLTNTLRKFVQVDITEEDITVLVSPCFWVSGLLGSLISLANGTTLIIYPKYDVDMVLSGVQRYRATSITLCPPQVVAIAKHHDVSRYDVSTLRFIAYGGASLSLDVKEEVEKLLNKTLTQFYGQTECLVTLLPGPLTTSKPGTVGVAAPNNLLKIVDIENGKTLGPNEEGEICMKGPTVFNGYYKNPEDTAKNLDADGWLHTGDVGHFDEDGYFFVHDRYKELIKFRGIQVSPADIENVLITHSAVKDAAVVGIEDDIDQEHPLGFVCLKEGQEIDVEELHNIVKEKLPKYKWLHGGIFIIDEIPRTATGKVKRRDLRQLARKLKTEES